MLVPTAVLSVIGIAVALLYKLDKAPGARKGLVKGFVVFVFLVFVTVSKSAFSLFNCRIMADGQFHLVGDLDVVCDKDPAHVQAQVIGRIMSILYPVGVPVGLYLVLRRAQLQGILFAKPKTGNCSARGGTGAPGRGRGGRLGGRNKCKYMRPNTIPTTPDACMLALCLVSRLRAWLRGVRAKLQLSFRGVPRLTAPML